MRYTFTPFVLTVFLATSCAHAPRTVPANSPATGGTAGTTSTPVSAPAIDTMRLHQLIIASAPDAPVQITFNWAFQDRDFKFSGRGMVRMQGPDHGRLDLFGPQDIQLLRATLNGDSLELAYTGPKVPIPPVPFLWATVGVLRPPVAGPPSSLTVNGASMDFGYDIQGEHWRFKADSTTLRSVEWLGADGGRRTVELTGPFQFNRPTKAVFRDWREFRELTLTVTKVEKVEPFAPGIWNVSNQ